MIIFVVSLRASEVGCFWAADGMGGRKHGDGWQEARRWLAEEDSKKETEERRKRRGRYLQWGGGGRPRLKKRRIERDFGSRGKTEKEREKKRKTY